MKSEGHRYFDFDPICSHLGWTQPAGVRRTNPFHSPGAPTGLSRTRGAARSSRRFTSHVATPLIANSAGSNPAMKTSTPQLQPTPLPSWIACIETMTRSAKVIVARIAPLGDMPLPRIDEDDHRQSTRLVEHYAIGLIRTLRQADHAQRQVGARRTHASISCD